MLNKNVDTTGSNDDVFSSAELAQLEKDDKSIELEFLTKPATFTPTIRRIEEPVEDFPAFLTHDDDSVVDGLDVSDDELVEIQNGDSPEETEDEDDDDEEDVEDDGDDLDDDDEEEVEEDEANEEADLDIDEEQEDEDNVDEVDSGDE